MNGTVRERMCLCMYATDPLKPWLERDIRFRSFFFTRLRPLLSASLFSSGPASGLQQGFYSRTDRTAKLSASGSVFWSVAVRTEESRDAKESG